MTAKTKRSKPSAKPKSSFYDIAEEARAWPAEVASRIERGESVPLRYLTTALRDATEFGVVLPAPLMDHVVKLLGERERLTRKRQPGRPRRLAPLFERAIGYAYEEALELEKQKPRRTRDLTPSQRAAEQVSKEWTDSGWGLSADAVLRIVQRQHNTVKR